MEICAFYHFYCSKVLIKWNMRKAWPIENGLGVLVSFMLLLHMRATNFAWRRETKELRVCSKFWSEGEWQGMSKTVQLPLLQNNHLFFCLFFCLFVLGHSPGNAQGLHSVVTCGGGQGTILDSGDQTWVDRMQGKCITHCVILPIIFTPVVTLLLIYPLFLGSFLKRGLVSPSKGCPS